MTVAGILDVALGSLGLLVATLMALAIGALVWLIAVVQWASFLFQGEFDVAPQFADAWPGILAYAALAAVSVFADLCLLLTGAQLLARSPKARRSAFLFAVSILPLGAIDVFVVQHGNGSGLALALVVALPAYSVAQFVAFFVLPSWRNEEALRRGSSHRISAS